MLDYLAILGLGVATGVFTRLVPGIHPNTVIFSSLPFYFKLNIDLILFMAFISGLSVSHTFHDFLPAIFLGAPEAESALSALPGGEMALRGRGLEAFDYTVFGGLYASLGFVLAGSFLLIFLEPLYGFLESFMGYILLFALLFIVFRSGKLMAAVIALLSGILGQLAFSMPVNQKFVLLPIFTGLFAVPSILNSITSRMELPEQSSCRVSKQVCHRGGALGFLSGWVAGTFPGLGAAVSTSFLTPLMDSKKDFLAAMGGVNTSDILMSFLALHLIGKARSGSSVALEAVAETSFPRIVMLLGMSLVAVAASVPLALKTSRFFTSRIRQGFGYALYLVLTVILALNYYLLGLPGLLILFTSASVGYIAMEAGERACCMAVLIVPAVMFYGGIFI